MKETEDLVLYKIYVEFMNYSYTLLNKYPNKEMLKDDIKKEINNGLVIIVRISKEYRKGNKLILLNELDVILKVLKVYSRISYKKKYITKKNYESFSKKITNLCNMMKGLMSKCRV